MYIYVTNVSMFIILFITPAYDAAKKAIAILKVHKKVKFIDARS